MNPEALATIPRNFSHAFEANMAVQGRAQIHVLNRKGEVIKTLPWQRNLVLDQGMNYYGNSNTWANLMNYCVAGTGTTPTKDLLDGTAGQSGTTVTLSGSTYSFSAGDVGKWVGWATGGYQAKITAYISATQVTVAQSQTVSTATATLYRCDQTGLTTEVKRSNTYPVYTYTDGRGASASYATGNVLTLRRTYDFTAEVGSVNYSEIGFSPVATVASNLFSRILLAGAVTVTSGQQLRVTYEIAVTVNGTTRPSQTLPSSVGWPYQYSIASITGNGTSFTVTTSTAHHYVTGGSITIAGALRTKTAITAASSTGSDFTITANSHGRTTGESITIAGMTPVGYNGVWTIASTTTNTITVTTGANPGTGTVFGTVRQTEPVTWYDGTWTVASTTSTTVVVTSAISLSAGADGTVKNNLDAVLYVNHWPIFPLGLPGTNYGIPVSPEVSGQWHGLGTFTYLASGVTNSPGTGSGGNCCMDGTYSPGTSGASTVSVQLLLKSSALTAPGSFPVTGVISHGASSSASVTTYTRQSYTNGNFYRDHLFEWGTGAGNSQIIRGFALGQGSVNSQPFNNDCSLAWYFAQPQRKDSTNRLRITYRVSWSRTLA